MASDTSKELIRIVRNLPEFAEENIPRYFEARDLNKRGVMGFEDFSYCLGKINRDFTSNQDLLFNIVQEFKIDKDNYSYKKFIARVADIKRSFKTVNGLFERLYNEIMAGRNSFFRDVDKECQGKDKDVAKSRFDAVFRSSVRTPLKAAEIDAILYLYGSSAEGSVSIRQFREAFEAFLKELNLGQTLEQLTSAKGYSEDPYGYWGRWIFIRFGDFFNRSKLKDPLKFFDEFNRGPDDTTTRYSFQEAVKRVIPTITENDYLKLEAELENEARSKIDLKKFVVMLDHIMKSAKPEEIKKHTSKRR